ncbi:MAG TPA: immune inhibitor A domain-containing protein [Gaiellaceae bacterium]|nr:immune inhibitor A domain-containing protein [Gaiellaceae bacterium]
MREKPRHRGARRFAVLVVLAATASIASSASAEIPPDAANHPLLQPIDAQNWVDQGELTWAAYTPVPDRKAAFYNPATSGTESQYRTAIVLVDFDDQPFLISQPPGSHPFGNPQPGWTPVAPEAVRQWMHEYYSTPNEFNGGMTLNSYWLEDTHGRIGVEPTTFGPYTMPGDLHEFGLGQFNGSVGSQADSSCPAGDTCGRDIRAAAGALWRADLGCTTTLCGYDNIFYVTAGHDESSTWQEFGEMLWEAREDVPAAFGPPGAADGPVLNAAGNPIPNWAPTRYVPWTSWRAASNHWPNAGGGSSTQAESSGQSVFAHEFSHLRGLPDNYNNPFGDTDRNYTGYWEMMSRGTFNGPGGTHNRWQIPNAGGSALGPHHMLHFKNRLNTPTSTILAADEQVFLERNTLATQGIAVARIQARESVPDDGELVGLTVNFGDGGDAAGNCANQGYIGDLLFYCPNRSGSYTAYRLEVVERVGNDSFVPGHGVLLSKSRMQGTPNVWLIDPNQQDIGMIDFYRPDGTPVAVVRGDPRQLNDATFHAGTRSGSAYEYVDTFNKLHFYVLDSSRDADGVLSYRLAVRRFDNGDPFTRGVALGTALKTPRREGFLATCSFPLTNTGQAGAAPFDHDVYRVSATSSSDDWKVTLPNALAAATAGQTVQVPVQVLRDPLTEDGDARTIVTLTAKSEADASKTATRTCNVHVRDTTPAG